MFLALLITPMVTLYHLGGRHEMLDHLAPLGTAYFHPLNDMTMISVVSLLAWGLGYFGQPHILVRFMAVKNVSALKSARRICMTWMTCALAGAMAVGIVGHAWFSNGIDHPESVFLQLAQDLFIPWIGGFLLAAVLSAVMSTVSAQLLAASSALTEDFYHRFLRKHASQPELVWVSRLTVGLIAIIAILLAYNPKDNILSLVSYAWAGLGASFGPVILFSLFWRRITLNAAIAGIISGATTVIVWKAWLSSYGGIFDLYEILPGFIIASLFIVIISFLSKSPSANITHDFDRVKNDWASQKT